MKEKTSRNALAIIHDCLLQTNKLCEVHLKKRTGQQVLGIFVNFIEFCAQKQQTIGHWEQRISKSCS